ncbi:DUF4197 domain-containing protein [Rhizobacter sp. Root1221]|uniref:DUF4197 domain-containing protein n=1 Tax=Rhizobacter sp. Root1221 TaxID=1736433 RepID=UPI0006F30317|nr:DUF4197 domain-containing protein [Rhizobacter sp. Root1221]KQV91641.1 hypothetical protein ASC87_06015 [Rhizobacter sp. Root1221]
MQRRKFTSATLLVLAAGRWGTAGASPFSETDAASGVRAALERGAVSAVGLLGRTDGFLGNPKVRIPLPGFLNDAASLLRATGQQKRVDALITAMNRAAESAVPEAKAVLVNTVKNLSVEDARHLVTGGDNSVTQFFADKTRVPLGERFLPIVTRATERVSLAAKYNAVAGKAAAFGLLRGDDANIERYVTGKALDGLYLMIGEEERKIRQDPIGTGSAILKKVFGGL